MLDEFKQLYDAGRQKIRNLEDAIDLAYDLGYEISYCDRTKGEEFDKMREYINKLVGEEWPKKVIDAYNKGRIQGYWDT